MTEPRRATLSALLSGFLFGLGLLVSGMADPQKVLAFLDVLGAWDPSLALVMGGAVAVSAVGFALARRRRTSLLGLPIQLPTQKAIDARLIVGATLFGVGWGLSGICPGPAVVLVAGGHAVTLLFVVPMLGGIALAELWANGPGPASSPAETE